MTNNQLTYFFVLFLWMFSIETSWGQSYKTEYRAVWVATVDNLDWPSNRINMEVQQQELIDILDSAAAWNLNSIFLQIRPKSDALYQSDLVPWSEFISGTRGTSPGYDPLAFAIEEGHKRGIEIHGWLNPYRYETSIGQYDGKPGDFNTDHPDWMLETDDLRILNPGVPEVREHLKDIVGEIINNYDIDGIHFDDYFYPYSGFSNQDLDTYETYGEDFDNIGDWRRDNVNTMIAMVKDTIASLKPYVRFGISPFGIYGNGENPDGISGLDAYNTIYTDPKQWLSSGSIDYICPQLYWPTGGAQDFGTLLPWWAEIASQSDRHVIAGHGLYRFDNNPAASARQRAEIHEDKKYFDLASSNTNARTMADSWTLDQISTQIDIVRENRDKNAFGSCYFRYEDFIRVAGVKDQIVQNHYQDIALMPAMTWQTVALLDAPANARWEQDGEGVNFVTWDEASDTDRYVLYSSTEASPDQTFFDDPANILAVSYDNSYYLSSEEIYGEARPYIFIATYDRYGNESAERAVVSVEPPVGTVTLSSPADSEINLPRDFDFEWDALEGVEFYLFELSLSETFDEVLVSEVISGMVLNTADIDLESETEYFWRVSPTNLAGAGDPSSVFSFQTGYYPFDPIISSPVSGEEWVDLTPLIQWDLEGQEITGVNIELARGDIQFQTYNVVLSETLGAVSEYQVTMELDEWTTYHVRIKIFNEYAESEWIYSSFKTLILLPEAPNIYEPTVNASIEDGEVLEVKWSKSDLATGYKATISSDAEMTEIVDSFESYSANDTTTSFSGLLPGDYYVSVQGKNVGGYGEAGQVMFTVDRILGVDDLSAMDSKPAMWAVYGDVQGTRVVFRETDVKETELLLYDALGRKLPIPELYYDSSQRAVLTFDDARPEMVILIWQRADRQERIKILVK